MKVEIDVPATFFSRISPIDSFCLTILNTLDSNPFLGVGWHVRGEPYLIERRLWKNRKDKSHMIKNVYGEILGYYAAENRGVVIKDVEGAIQSEVQFLSETNFDFRILDDGLAVFGPQHTLRGTVKRTGRGMSFFIFSTPDQFMITDSQGKLLAVLRATWKQRVERHFKLKTPEGGLVANVYPSLAKEFIQIDITEPGFDPLLVLAYVLFTELINDK